MSKERWLDLRFGERLKAEREARGWSQPHFAELLEAQGVTPMHATTVAKIESGKRSVRVVEALGMAEVFDVSIDSLMGRTLGPADAELTLALRVLRDSARRSADQAIDLRFEIQRQVRSIVSAFDFDRSEELGKLADAAHRRLGSAYDAVEELASRTEDVLSAKAKATRKTPRLAKAVRL